MYRAFNLQGLTTGSFEHSFDDFKRIGHSQNEQTETSIRQSLEAYTGVDGTIDGSGLQEHWFPKIDAEVFISHSHADTDLAKALAGWLYYHFSLTSFIDSCVWGYSEDLLRSIDNKHCRHDRNPDSYSYEKRNNSTSHVHMMLATALGKMIDKTECLIFLNTPNSISTADIDEPETHSPWLLFELGLASIIRREDLRRSQLTCLSESDKRANDLNVKYKLTKELEKLHPVTTSTLGTWRTRHQQLPADHALDTLYELTKPKS